MFRIVHCYSYAGKVEGIGGDVSSSRATLFLTSAYLLTHPISSAVLNFVTLGTARGMLVEIAKRKNRLCVC
jgi:hypothetical protein